MTVSLAVQAGLYPAVAAFPVALLIRLDRDFERTWGERPGEGRPWAREPGPVP